MRWLCNALIVGAVVLASACQGGKDSLKNRATGGAGSSAAASAEAWPFWPTRMRFHPATRLVSGEDGRGFILDARLEFQDAFGDLAKAVGLLTIQLYGDSETPTAAEALQTWNLDLRDLASNRRQYDQITRTYLLRMHIDPAAVTDEAELRAMFVSVDGQQFETRYRLRSKRE